MRKLMTVMIVGFSLQFLAVQVWASQRIALVIGNAAYQHGSGLANPLNDANDIGAALGRLGFKVTKLENADYDGMRRGLKAFTRAAATSEIALVFYAGHGIEVDKRNFLIPVDARLLSDREVEFETVSLGLVSRAVEGATSLGLVILDACRDNPFAAAMKRSGAKRSIGRGLARVEPSGETLVAYAAKGGSVAADGEGRNSPYSTALLALVEEPGLEVGLMFRKVRDAVLRATGGVQEPFVYGSLSSKGVYLKPAAEDPTLVVKVPPKEVTPEPAAPGGKKRLTAEQLAAERVFWESVHDTSDRAEIKAYLQQYPDGTYAALARARLKRLPGTTKKVLPKPKANPEPRVTPEMAEMSIGLDLRERQLIQSGLSSLGFDAGPTDGVFGPRTRSAIENWQASLGKSVTGHLDAEAAKKLVEKGKTVLAHGKPAAMATLAKALNTAAKIGEARKRVSALVSISRAYAAVDDIARATHILSKALDAAAKIGETEKRVPALVSIGEAYARVGDVLKARRTIAEALAVADKIEKERDRYWAIIRAVRAQANVGDLPGAKLTVEGIDIGDQAYALSIVAAAQAKHGDIRGAEKSIAAALALVREGDFADLDRVRLAINQAEAGNFRGAFAVFETVEGRNDRVQVLYEIATAQTEAGDIHGAKRTISDALAIVERISVSKGSANSFEDWKATVEERVEGFTLLAKAYVETGETQGATKLISRALALTNEFERELNYPQAWINAAKARYNRRLAVGDYMGATLAHLEAKWSDGTHRPTLVGMFRKVAVAQATAGGASEARMTAERIKDAGDIGQWALIEIAAAQAKARDFAGASATAARVRKESDQARALVEIAIEQAKARDFAGAVATAERIGTERLQVWALYNVAIEQAKARDFAEAVVTAERIGTEDRRFGALHNVAVEQAKAGDFAAAVATAERIGRRYNLVRVLTTIATSQGRAATR